MEEVKVVINGHTDNASEYLYHIVRGELASVDPSIGAGTEEDIVKFYQSDSYDKEVSEGYGDLIGLLNGLNGYISRVSINSLTTWLVQLQKLINLVGGEDSKSFIDKDEEAQKGTILCRLGLLESLITKFEKFIEGYPTHYNFVKFDNKYRILGEKLEKRLDAVEQRNASLVKSYGNLSSASTKVKQLEEELAELKSVIGSLSKSQGSEASYKQRLVYNHTPKYEWEGHAFRSKQEMEVAIALDALGVVYGPNVGVRVTEGEIRKTREVDFMVYLDGHTGILECDSVEFHNADNDIERDRNFQRQGIYFIKRYTSKECLNPNWVAEDFIKSMRFFYAK